MSTVIYSPTAGILVSAARGWAAPDIHYLAGQERLSEFECLYVLSSIQDWQVLGLDGIELVPLIEKCTLDYWVSRSQSLFICLIEGVSDSLATEVLEHVESILQSHCSADEVLNRLLIAPLKEPRRVETLAVLALSAGFATTAELLDRLVDRQTLLTRFAGTWLNLPVAEFVDLPAPRETLWQKLAMRSILTRLLEAVDKLAFTTAWSELVYDETSMTGRRAIARLGNTVADAIYPTSVRRTLQIGEAGESGGIGDDIDWTSHNEDFPSHTAYSRALKQVNAIAREVAQGNDMKASRFLRELIEEQLRSSNRDQLTKSLCNIAQKCAYMFRADFERLCLDRALSFAPDDAWTLIQMGNHLKRVGEFDDAIGTLRRAAGTEHARIALSSIADVWCEAGEYAKAVEAYQGVLDWQNCVEVRTGLADIRRYKGEFDDALLEYDRILAQWPDDDRAAAGKADIFRRLGRFDKAIEVYDSLIYDPATDNFAKLVYRLSKCTVLKQSNRLTDAYNLADHVVRIAPFYMSARVHRASILALLGKEAMGLASLPRKNVPRAFGTWITQYCRGLLLLKLERYKEARSLLIDRLSSSLLTSDNRTVLRLGAALAFLYQDDIEPAATVLSQIQDVRDYYTEYVYHVLELHVAVARRDEERVAEVAKRLEDVREKDLVVVRAISALREGDFRAAKGYELELLLRIAA